MYKFMPHGQATKTGRNQVHYDFWLISIVISLIALGLVMVSSSSITLADRLYDDPFHYFWRQSIAVGLGLLLAVGVIRIPLFVWQYLGPWMIMVGVVLLILVLVPGLGREVNGSMRWISIGPVNVQGSEPVKIFVITYLAGYLVRHSDKVRTSFTGFIRPVGVVTLISGLLLMEPDYGSAAVLFVTALGMLFVGGAPLSRFFAWMLTAVIALVSLAVISPYRMQRITSFMNPWQDPFDTGFQLTQALIAFGRGDLFGTGLGSSVQKLFYLPEAHTDFVFAVLAEELGLIGCVLVIMMYFFIIWRSFVIAQIAEGLGKQFAAYMAYGIGLIIGLQAFINIGVNTGILPTKGLTLPLISYGGNSMVTNCILLALLIRIEFENHFFRKDKIPDPVKRYVA